MAHIDSQRIDGTRLRTLLGLSGGVLAIELPGELTAALRIASGASVRRAKWRDWLPAIAKAKVVLLWVSEREADDQEFLTALGRHLPEGALLWSFHAMGVLTVDRLTGDAVQMLLTTHGLVDGKCANTGFGYYIRSYKRARGSQAHPVPKPEKRKPERAEKRAAGKSKTAKAGPRKSKTRKTAAKKTGPAAKARKSRRR